MNKKQKKHILIIAVAIIVIGVSSNFAANDNVYDYLNPQPLQLEQQEFDTLSQDEEINIKDDGYITQVYADDDAIYYLLEPVLNDMSQGLSYELAYIKKMDKQTGEVKTLREFSDMGKFNISEIIYNEEFCFIHMTTFDYNDESVKILKMCKQTGDIDVIYETSRITNGGYDISDISNSFTNDYLIWREFDPYTQKNEEVNEYKLYNIEKDEVTTQRFEEESYQRLYTNPTIHEDKIVYNVSNDTSDNIIVCKSVGGQEKREINTHNIGFNTGFYNDEYVVWDNPVWLGVYGKDIGKEVYLFDFNTQEQFLVTEDALDLKLYNDYIVMMDKDYVSLIDYRNNKKYKYLIEENQQVTSKVVNVTDNYIITSGGFYNDDNGITLTITYKAIVK